MAEKNTVAIVCGGGPAPGMNAVISAVTYAGYTHGWKVVGIYDGFSRLGRGEKKYIELTPDNTATIHYQGGCVLKMSRFNPTKNEADLKRVVDTLTELGVTHLVTIGGDDTAFSSSSVSAYAKSHGGNINVVHVPKTIDNDLPLPEGIPTFGFETARDFGTVEVKNLMEDARTTDNRWYFAVAMGRTAGHLALGMGKTAGAAITVIPEEFKEKIHLQQVVDIIVGSIVKRHLLGKNYGVAVIAEGVVEKIDEEDLKKIGDLALDEHGHIRYAELDFGGMIKKLVLAELEKLGLKLAIVTTNLGYEFRCTSPIPYDIEYARSLGYEAFMFLYNGNSGSLISIQGTKAVPLTFEEIKDPATGKTRVRRVNCDSVNYQIARGLMNRIEKADLDNAEIAAGFKMSVDEFKNRYKYLFD